MARAAFAFSILCTLIALASPSRAVETGAAYINTKVALARSGPGLEHYATDALALGDMVEVIERQNGWAAIRPTLDAYSWIGADKLRKIDEQEAEVIAESAKAWIGSDVEQVAKHVTHVQLRRGERVAVIGQKEVSAGAAAEVWFKIKPPVGEKRWVKESELSDSPPLGSPRSTSRLAPPPDDDGWTTRGSRSGLNVLADQLPEERAKHHSSRSSFIGARERLENFEDELVRLQLAITRAATDSTSSQRIAELEHEIEDLLDNGRTALERGQATRLLESAEELKELAEQREQLGLSGSDNESDSADDPTDTTDEKRPLTRFQIKGWLMPVAWYGRPTELCAIMNDEHTPIAFVSPAPGVNLRRYLNKEVGIVGEESFNKIHDKRHIVAHRVVELSRHRDAKPETFANIPWIRFRPKKQTASMADLMAEDVESPDVQVD